jgi:hypothetical protein
MKQWTRLSLTIGTIVAAVAIAPMCASVAPLAAGSGAQNCDSARFPQAKTQVQCCQEGNSTWHNDGNGNLLYRTYGTPCREEDGIGMNCGVGSNPFKQCAYGACGAKNEIIIAAKKVYVFKPGAAASPTNILSPPSLPARCGFAAYRIFNIPPCTVPGCVPIGGEVSFSFPENYLHQQLYPGVQGTCTFTSCKNGIPQ